MFRSRSISMTANISILIIFLSLSFSFWGGNAQTPPPPPSLPWEGFRLTLQWPPAFCEVNYFNCHKGSLLNTFTISGLWPYDINGSSLINCQGAVFDVNSVSTFAAEMNLAWPSYTNTGTSVDFWAYEWDVHGKCSASVLGQTNYFKTSLAFRNAFDILGILNREGIYPIDAFYPREMIIEAIRKNLNSVPALSCKPNSRQERMLSEIYLCVNQLATAFVDCPTPTERCSTDTVKFVSLASSQAVGLHLQ